MANSASDVKQMQFGFFDDLSEPDQAYIRGILSYSSDASNNACKGLIKPEFSWISTSEVDLSNQTSENVSADTSVNTSGNPVEVLPSHPVGISVLQNVGFSSHVGVPVGFQMGQFIGHYPGGMLPTNMMPVFMTPHMYGVPPPGVQHIPVPMVNPNTCSDNHTEYQAVQETIEQTEENGSTVDENGKVGESKSGKKTYERRNKKKRPPGYYEKIAATQGKGDFANADKSSTTSSSSEATSSNEQDYVKSDNKEVERTNVNVEENKYCSVPQSSTLNSSAESVTVHEVQDPSYAHLQSSVNVSHTINNEPSPVSAEESSKVASAENELHDPCDNKTVTNIKSLASIAQDTIKVNSAEIETQCVAEEKVNDSDVTEMCEDSKVVKTDKIDGLESQMKDVSIGEENTNKATSEEIKDNQVDSVNSLKVQESMNKESDGKTSVPKKSSWAGLFSDTKQAKNATVIYTGSSKPAEQENNNKEPVVEEKVPTVVSLCEDKLAPTIGDILLSHQINHKGRSLQPRGLRNKRNWCYISATLQALLACPPFYNLMRALPCGTPEERGPSSTPVIDCLCEFVKQFNYLSVKHIPDANKTFNGKGTVKVDIPQGQPFEPTNVHDVLKTSKFASAFMAGRQEDAEEFLGCFLNGLHDEMLSCIKCVKDGASDVTCNGTSDKPSEESSEVDQSADNAEEEGWEQVGPRNKAVVTRTTDSPSSPISEMFQGQIRSILHQTGARESATLQPFFTLQLDIQSEKVWTVKDALEGLVKKESLHDYTCTKTKQEVEATRRITLEELPPVLILHLKYFLYDKSGGCQKLTKPVDFGVDLEINKDLLSPNVKSKMSLNQRKYKLFGVVNHHGARAVGGHYTAYVFHVGINGWIHIDDEIIRTVNVAQVMKHNPPRVPYLLYYRKVEA